MADRSARVCGRFAGHRNDPGDLFGGERAPPPGPGLVAEDLPDGRAEFGRLAFALDADQRFKPGPPALAPDPDGVPFAIDVPGDAVVPFARERTQDHVGSLGESLRATASVHHFAEDFLLSFGQRATVSFEHFSNLHRPKSDDFGRIGGLIRQRKPVSDWLY